MIVTDFNKHSINKNDREAFSSQARRVVPTTILFQNNENLQNKPKKDSRKNHTPEIQRNFLSTLRGEYKKNTQKPKLFGLLDDIRKGLDSLRYITSLEERRETIDEVKEKLNNLKKSAKKQGSDSVIKEVEREEKEFKRHECELEKDEIEAEKRRRKRRRRRERREPPRSESPRRDLPRRVEPEVIWNRDSRILNQQKTNKKNLSVGKGKESEGSFVTLLKNQIAVSNRTDKGVNTNTTNHEKRNVEKRWRERVIAKSNNYGLQRG